MIKPLSNNAIKTILKKYKAGIISEDDVINAIYRRKLNDKPKNNSQFIYWDD